MNLVAVLVSANLLLSPKAMLMLEKLRAVDDPRMYDLRDDVAGDRGVPASCALSDKTTVTLTRAGNATLEVARGDAKKKIVVEDVRGLGRSTLACGEFDDFYFVNPRDGQVHAYSADRLMAGGDPVLWTRSVEPFTSIDDAKGVMTDASVATALQVRRKLVLVEWFFRKNGDTGFWHAVFDAATGDQLDKIGPSDLLAKTNEHDPWWIVFQGGGNDTVNYVPQNIYRLRYGVPAAGDEPAAETIDALRKRPAPPPPNGIAHLSANPIINHMIAFLTPTRTSQSARIEFCPTAPTQRAQYWLGNEYDAMLGELARNILLAFWAERESLGVKGNPIDAWFQAEVAAREPMKGLLKHFNPQDDEWIAQYQQGLYALSRPTLEALFTKYGVKAGAVVRESAEKKTP
jgi:hypothetical protein